MGEWLHLVSFDWFCFEDYLSFLHFEPVFVFRAEVSLLEAVYTWVLFLIHPTTLCLLTGEFTSFAYRVINKWGLSTAILIFSFSLLYIYLHVAFSLYLSAVLVWWLSKMFFPVPPFLCLCFCSTFMFCGYNENCMKCLKCKVIHFLLFAFYLHLPIPFHSFSFPLLCFCCLKLCVQSLSHVRLFATPWIAAYQTSLSFTISRSLLKFMSVESVMLFNHLIFCLPPSLAFNLSQYENLFQWVGTSHQVAKVLELQH